MLHESSHVRVTADDGVATLEFHFPGRPVNPLSAARLVEIDRGLTAVANAPAVEVLVIRSGRPDGFCGGFDPQVPRELHTDSEAAAFAATGQRVLGRLANLPVVTVAFIHGACLGPGLELALACDHRLAVTGPDAWVGLGDQLTCWGGRTRLNGKMGPFTAREAANHGVLDHAFCERRAKVELRTWLDRVQANPRKRPGWWGDAGVELAAERAAFRAAVRDGLSLPPDPPAFDTLNPVPPLKRVGLIGDGERVRWLAAEFAMRGVDVVWVGGSAPASAFRDPVRRGRVTPLEAEQAVGRIAIRPDADGDAVRAAALVVLDDSASAAAGLLERDLPPRTVLAVPPAVLSPATRLAAKPGRVVGLEFGRTSASVHRHDDTTPDTLAAVTGWLAAIDCRVHAVRQAVDTRSLLTV
jgi:enoyl-CoA hydratase/carnithine racemase